MCQCICNDVKCIYKNKEDICKLDVKIASEVFNTFGLTTCEVGIGTMPIPPNRKRSINYTINKMLIQKKQEKTGDV